MTAPCVPLCGYDVHHEGARQFEPVDKRRPPCRRVARWVVRDWLDEHDDLMDLYLCDRHTAALVKLHPDDVIEPERVT